VVTLAWRVGRVTSFRVLGPVEAWVDERRLTLGGPQQVKLLAFLLLHGNHAVSADAVIDAIWGSERDGAVNRLRVGVVRLRKALARLDGPDGSRLRTVSGGYVLDVRPNELDAETFAERVRDGLRALDEGDPTRASELLGDALGLWRGPPLAEVAFEDFAQAEIRRLEELRLTALETRIDADLQLGRHAGLIPELQALLADEPTRERVGGQLMRALYRSGRQADALEVYQRIRTRLAEDLGLEPGPAIRTIQEQVLSHDPALSRSVPSSRRSVGVEPRDTSAGVTAALAWHQTPLVERDAELVEIRDLVRRAARGISSVLLVEGDAGVGKTRLLETVGEAARAERVPLFRASGGELEWSFAFGVARQLFGPLVATLDPGRRRSLLSGAASLAGAVVDPSLSVESPTPATAAALYARLHGLYWLCAGLAEQRPLILLVDDAHWADDPSLQWLLFMTRRLRDMPLAIVLASRPINAGDSATTLRLIGAEAGTRRIKLSPLSESGAALLVRRFAGHQADDQFCLACHRATGGNPFLLQALTSAVSEDGIVPTVKNVSQIESLAPDAITRSVVVRLGRMSHGASALARAITVLGVEAQLRQAAYVADLDAGLAATAADELVASGLLERGQPLRLVHPIVRTVLYADLPLGQRSQLHRRAATILADEGGDLDAAAMHLLGVEPAGDMTVVEALSGAAWRALDRGAPSVASEFFRRALVEPPPREELATLLAQQGLAATLSGDPTGAEQHYSRAMTLSQEPRHVATLALDISGFYIVTDRINEAISTLENAIRRIGENDDELRWQLEAQLIGAARSQPAHVPLAAAHLASLPPDVRGETRGERLILAQLAYAAAIGSGTAEQASELGKRALGNGQLLSEESLSSVAPYAAIGAVEISGALDCAIDAFDRLLARARVEGAVFHYTLISSFRSGPKLRRGAVADAIADARSAIEAGGHFGWDYVAPSAYSNLINALLETGELDAAEDALTASGVGDEIPDMPLFGDLLLSRGRLRLAQGDTRAGIDDLTAAQDMLERLGITNPARKHCRSTIAIALAAMGERDDARQLVEAELAAARAFGDPTALGIALRAAGLVEPGGGGIDYLRDAVRQLGGSQTRLEYARALLDLGAALRRTGARREATSLLRQALGLADRCGARVIAEQARAELRISGARPRRARITAVKSLTPSERRVAELAASGLTNREIAQALFVSQPTVVTHLGRCYQKLGARSRKELVQALDRSVDDYREIGQTRRPVETS
jgi:DNA-binding SARP family transcriptional activator/DNA-binding CsgD family transcriptional regulator